jgi:hypothetical protein
MATPTRLKLRSTRMALVLLWSACLLTSAYCCPNCKDSFAQNGGGGDLVRGYGWSIIFMLSMPFLILASLGTYFWLLVRRAGPRTPALLGTAFREMSDLPETSGPRLVEELVTAESQRHK